MYASFIDSEACLTTGPQSLPKPVLQIERSSASSFNFQYSLLSLRSSSSCLRLLSRLHVTSIFPSIFPSITYFVWQFLRKMWPIQLTFLLFIVRGIIPSSSTPIILSSSTPCNSLLLRFSRDRLQTHRRRAKTATCIINVTVSKQPSNQRFADDVHTSTLISN